MSNDTYDMRVRMLFRSRTVRIDCTKGFATLIALTKSWDGSLICCQLTGVLCVRRM